MHRVLDLEADREMSRENGTSSNSIRIGLIHNKLRKYRIPIFKRLSEKWRVIFYIFQEERRKIKEIEKVLRSQVKRVGRINLFRKLMKEDLGLILNPDFVFLEAWIAALVAKIRDIPLVQWTEVWDPPSPSRSLLSQAKSVVKGLMVRLLGKLADSFIAPGENQKKYLLKKGVKPESIFLAPNAPNLQRKTQKRKKNFGLDTDEYLILYLGQLIRRKGVEDILKAAALLEEDRDDFQLFIGGKGNKRYENYLKKLVERLKLDNIKFLGWINEDALPSLYERADIFVSPSLKDPYPLTVTEAISFGTPVIISNAVGEADDLIHHGENGYIVPLNSPKAIYQCLSNFLSHPNKQKKMSKKAKLAFEKQSTYNHMEEAFECAINKALKRKT